MGIQYKLEKKGVGQPKKELDQNDPISTAERIAKQHHVGPATVKRAEKFADAVDRLPTERRKEVLEEKRKCIFLFNFGERIVIFLFHAGDLRPEGFGGNPEKRRNIFSTDVVQ